MIKRTLYFGNPAYLSLKLRQLVIRKPEVKGDMPEFDENGAPKDIVKTIPIEDIGLIVLDCPQITVTQGLLEALLENNCAVVTCDKSHLPTGLLLSLYGNKLQAERYASQVEASLPLKKTALAADCPVQDPEPGGYAQICYRRGCQEYDFVGQCCEEW